MSLFLARIASDAQLKGTVYGDKARSWLEGTAESKTPVSFNCTGCHGREDLALPARP